MINAIVLLTFGHAGVDVDEGRGAEGCQHQHDRQRHAHVTDAVDHERLLRSSCGRRLVLPEADQQVRRQADALPADEEHQVVVGQDEQQHRGDEQVEESEEAAPSIIMRHVADGVHVDQTADAGDQQHENDGELVDEQPDIDVPPSTGDPVVQRYGHRTGGNVAAKQLDEVDQTQSERDQRRDRAEVRGPTIGPPANQQQDRSAHGRDGDQQPGHGEQAGGRHRCLEWGHQSPLELQQIRVVDRGRVTGTEDGHDDR